MLCQYKMPSTFTVKAGFNMPGKDMADSPGTNSVLESVEPEYYDDFLTSQSLGGLDSHHMMSPNNIVSQRNSRTLTSNLFGWREVGNDDDASGDKKMWMIVITVASGLVMVSIIAVLVACRPKHSQTSDMEIEEMSSSTSQVNYDDTDALQPRKEKKLYRPSESRA